MTNKFTYEIGEDIYINLTNKCTNDCDFCIRKTSDGVAGYNLWLKVEPEASEVIKYLSNHKKNVVFCGYGEPTIKIEQLKEIAAFVKTYYGHVRVNTNGHGSIYHNRDIAKELVGLVDEISISLNESDSKKYEKVVHSDYKEKGFDYMLDFARDCIKYGIKVILSVVDVISEQDVEKCRKIAQDMGADFRLRVHIE